MNQPLLHSKPKRALALGMALALSCEPVLAAGAEKTAPLCDESYYATMDYYGGLLDSSVVKSYRTFGANSITDYGVYDRVENLTDDRTPTIADGKLTFDLTGDVPDTFYFEGKTTQPFQELPWTISLSYRLNGVPTPAEELAGKSGLVEINLDVTPNPAATAYLKNNLVLTAATAFNADDILSLEAPGAQVQLIGNLRAVLFMVMPGEEQHFTIRVGSEDFSFPGMVLLAVPATLQQLDQIADLREAKEKTEASYDAINDSLDVILNSLEGMSGSLNATANGLDELNRARDTISQGKGQVYADADAALGDLDRLAADLEPAAGHLATASRALTETTEKLNQLSDNASALKPQLATAREIIVKLQGDAKALKNIVKSAEAYSGDLRTATSRLNNDMYNLSSNADALEGSLNSLDGALRGLGGISSVDEITVNGMTVSQIKAAVAAAQDAYALYQAQSDSLPPGTTFVEFLQYGGKTEEEAQQIAGLLQMSQDPDFQAKLEQAEEAGSLIGGVNDKIGEVNGIVGSLAGPTAGVVSDLSDLSGTMGSNGMGDHLQQLTEICNNVLRDTKDDGGAVSALLDHAGELGDLLTSLTENADQALDLIDSLTETMNTYEPQAEQALADAQALTDTAVATIRDASGFLGSLKTLMQESGGPLDTGTEQALSGLAAALRQSTRGLAQTDTIRSAKQTVTSLIDDEWESHTGGDNNLLLMDPAAAPVSMTSGENPAPASIQFVMRTQEIQTAEPEETEDTVRDNGAKSTVWSRIADMFRDIWQSIKGIFHRD